MKTSQLKFGTINLGLSEAADVVIRIMSNKACSLDSTNQIPKRLGLKPFFGEAKNAYGCCDSARSWVSA